MNRRNQRKLQHLVNQATELSFAAPQVAAHRMGRMATAGGPPSARDRAEFQRMAAEKPAAWIASWTAMGWELLRAQQAWLASLARSALRMSPAGPAAMASMFQAASLGLMASGLEPVHRAATANARRLAALPARAKRRR